ncbi:MAG: transcriptional repressor [Phycisphaeraceae bacterium]|nr:MAG: transcriptional repressor [Phycisphaeraceae bacterium]
MCDARTLFARHGLRCTKQRMEVYNALAETTSHPTAEELYCVVREREPGVSLATVYNTLEVLNRHGLCRRLPSAGSRGCRFDADLGNHVHITADCGQVQDIPEDLGARLLDSLPKELLREVEERMGIRISRVAIELAADGQTPANGVAPRGENGCCGEETA